jgi:hypothetical protein
MATLSPEQLDELVLHLVIRRANAEKGSAEPNAAEAALDKLFEQYPDAEHMAMEHVHNMGSD